MSHAILKCSIFIQKVFTCMYPKIYKVIVHWRWKCVRFFFLFFFGTRKSSVFYTLNLKINSHKSYPIISSLSIDLKCLGIWWIHHLTWKILKILFKIWCFYTPVATTRIEHIYSIRVHNNKSLTCLLTV